MFFLFNCRGGVWAVIVSGPDDRGSGQGVDFFLNRSQQLLRRSTRKIGSAHRPYKQGIPAKNVTVGVETHTTRGVPRRVNYPQADVVAYLDEILVIQQNIRRGGSFAPEYPGKSFVHHLSQSTGIQFVYEKLCAGGSFNRLVSGGVIRMSVGIDDMCDPVFQTVCLSQNPISFKGRIDQGAGFGNFVA